MKNILFLILSAIPLLSLFSCSSENLSQDGSIIRTGDLIPNFSVEMNDGSTVTGQSLRSGVSCIVFFNTACPDCNSTMPYIQSIYDRYSTRGVKFAIISREEGNDTVSAYWKDNGFTMPYSAQTNRAVYNLFASHTIPRIYIGNLSGRIVACFDDSPLPTDVEISSLLDQFIR